MAMDTTALAHIWAPTLAAADTTTNGMDAMMQKMDDCMSMMDECMKMMKSMQGGMGKASPMGDMKM